ncbi:MAG TPA: STAS domain-containing protein [Streptosporangiaceae bacterium]|nr:STAS domain-containing protein [Streptosporangiaceae bacterium]
MTPDLLDTAAAEAAGEHLLSATGQAARLLIIDMSATVICDYAAADSIVKACTRAIAAGPEVRLVATGQLARHLLRISGLGHLICVYSSLPDAIAGPAPGAPCASGRGNAGLSDCYPPTPMRRGVRADPA